MTNGRVLCRNRLVDILPRRTWTYLELTYLGLGCFFERDLVVVYGHLRSELLLHDAMHLTGLLESLCLLFARLCVLQYALHHGRLIVVLMTV